MVERNLVLRPFFNLRGLPFFDTLDEEMAAMRNWPSANIENNYDLSSDDNNFYVKVAVPGFKPEDINIELKDGVLFVHAEQKEKVEDKKRKIHRESQRKFSYQIALPDPIDEKNEPQAQSTHGIVEITIPKAKLSQTKKIKVNHGS